MKIFAFFLPQYHEIAENDKWWGKGFTEWTNVKKAVPVYPAHVQPKHPLNNNYYNLLDKETVRWQTNLLHEYSVDGLIYYHYYFKGKLLLEKPAENLLRYDDIIQPFFFCWANHSWVRSWEGKKDVLMEQTYGGEDDWETHFQYLLPFFHDIRYEKVDNRPLFMIFYSNFAEKKKMLNYFDKRCREDGFNGIYAIETFHGTGGLLGYLKSLTHLSPVTERIFIRQPSMVQRLYDRKKHTSKGDLCKGEIPVYSGDELFKIMTKKAYRFKRVINGVFFEWDNTPRHGQRGYVITAPSEERFRKYLSSIENAEYIFINAWNEWAEGMTMEPTEENGYQYLEWIRDWRTGRNI